MGSAKSKLRPISEGRSQQELGRREPKAGKISRQKADDELQRNNRVVEIRADGEAGRKRRTRKAG